jgi:hypothetical protein
LPPVSKGRDPIHLEDLQALTALLNWQKAGLLFVGCGERNFVTPYGLPKAPR